MFRNNLVLIGTVTNLGTYSFTIDKKYKLFYLKFLDAAGFTTSQIHLIKKALSCHSSIIYCSSIDIIDYFYYNFSCNSDDTKVALELKNVVMRASTVTFSIEIYGVL